MKNLNKIVFAFSALMFVSVGASFAYINESDVSSIETLKQQGFNEATLEIIDNQKAKFDFNGNYTRYYNRNPKSKNIFGRAYTKVKNYVDPIQEDHLFGDHQINYTNNWTGEKEDYVPKSTVKQVENL